MKVWCAILPLIPALLIGALLLLPEVSFDVDSTVIKDKKDLPPKIKEWLHTGTIRTLNGWKLYTKTLFPSSVSSAEEQNKMFAEKAPAVLLHGFPSSSFEFHKVAQPLADKINAPVLLLDHLGFGFSEKPKDSDLLLPSYSTKTESSFYSYSCIDHAEHVFMLLEALDVKKAHFVAHDMGDTILAEMMGRRYRRTLPARFLDPEFFQSVTFTNGGMVYKHISKRLSQIILTTPGLSEPAQRLINRLDPSGKFMTAQLKTVWSPALLEAGSSSAEIATQDIADIATLLRWQGGHRIMNYLIRYLPDRATFESRWHPALKNLHKLVAKKCGYVWGDSDAVAPMAIVNTLQEANPGNCPLQTLFGNGHFLQLEAPEEWVEAVAKNML